MQEHKYINDAQQLEQLCLIINELNHHKIIAIDTEFIRKVTFYPRLSLLQICIDKKVYIIDAWDMDISPLLEAMINFKGTSLFFSCNEDIETLNHLSNLYLNKDFILKNIVDLQAYIAFCGAEHMLGLNHALEEYLNISILKSQTLSDWSLRPLDSTQIQYAIEDVYYLEDLYFTLDKIIKAQNREIFNLYMQEQLIKLTSKVNTDELYRYVGGAGFLNNEDLNFLKHLCALRYKYCQDHDISQNHFIPSNSLVDISKKRPKSLAQLASIGLKSKAIKEYGNVILKLIKKIESYSLEESLLDPYDKSLYTRDNIYILKSLKKDVKQKALEFGINKNIIYNKRQAKEHVYAVVHNIPSPFINSWRKKMWS